MDITRIVRVGYANYPNSTCIIYIKKKKKKPKPLSMSLTLSLLLLSLHYHSLSQSSPISASPHRHSLSLSLSLSLSPVSAYALLVSCCGYLGLTLWEGFVSHIYAHLLVFRFFARFSFLVLCKSIGSSYHSLSSGK